MRLNLILIAAIWLFPVALFGATGEVVVKDTSGFTRAVSQVEDQGDVEFELVGARGLPADGVEVLLTSEGSGKVLTAVAANGTVLFQGVSPGIWVVSTASSEITFVNVAIASVGVGAGATGGASAVGAIAAVGAVGGGTVGIVSATDSGNDNSPPLSPSS